MNAKNRDNDSHSWIRRRGKSWEFTTQDPNISYARCQWRSFYRVQSATMNADYERWISARANKRRRGNPQSRRANARRSNPRPSFSCLANLSNNDARWEYEQARDQWVAVDDQVNAQYHQLFSRFDYQNPRLTPLNYVSGQRSYEFSVDFANMVCTSRGSDTRKSIRLMLNGQALVFPKMQDINSGDMLKKGLVRAVYMDPRDGETKSCLFIKSELMKDDMTMSFPESANGKKRFYSAGFYDRITDSYLYNPNWFEE